MRKQHLVIIHPIPRHEQPARQPLFDAAAGIGQGRISALDAEYVRVAQEAFQHRPALVHCPAQVLSRDALALTLDLYEDLAGRAMGAENDRQAGHAVTADDSDLRLTAFTTADRHHRYYPAHEEANIIDQPVRTLQTLTSFQGQAFVMRLQQG